MKSAGITIKSLTRKDQIIEAMERELAVNLRGVVDKLSDAEKKLLTETVHSADCELPAERVFYAKYGVARPLPQHYYSYNEPVSLLAPMIVNLRDSRYGEPGVASDLIQPLRAILPAAGPVKMRTIERLPTGWPSEQMQVGGDLVREVQLFESERLAPAELGRVLRLVQGGKVKVAESSKRPTEATTRLVGEVLVAPEFNLEKPLKDRQEWERNFYESPGVVRAHAWPVLIQQCGWAKRQGAVLTLTADGKDILHQFTPEKYRHGVKRFVDNTDFDELNRVNQILGQTGKAKRCMTDPAMRKRIIAKALQAFPPNAWMTFAEAQRIVEALPEPWDVCRISPTGLYLCDSQYGIIYTTSGINRQYLRSLFMEALATLGVLDIAFVYPHNIWPDLSDNWGQDGLPFCGRYDGLLFVRLNALGAFALEASDSYEMQPESKPKLFRVHSNLEITLLTSPLNPADRATLELFAAPLKETLWRIETESLLTHVETGGTLKEAFDFLANNAEEELPEGVTDLFEHLDANIQACVGRREATLIEWANEDIARHIAGSEGLRKLCYHAGQNRVVVPAQNLTAFTRHLKRLGFVLPAKG